MAALINTAGNDQLDGPSVRLAPLVDFDFLTVRRRLWPGMGPLIARGYTWEGTAGLGQMSVAGQSPAGIVEEIAFVLAGDAALLDAADEDALNQETIGRAVQVWLQQFDVRFANDWQTLGDPFLYFSGTMGPMIVEQTAVDNSGTLTRTISVTAQNDMKNLGRAPQTYWSPTEQTARGAGTDAICNYMSEFVNGSVRWPQFT